MPGGVVQVKLVKDLLPEYKVKVNEGFAQAVMETCIAIDQDVKGGAHAAPIRTGNLRRSYHVEVKRGAGGVSGTVGNDMGIAPYAIYVEYGTYKMAAQPHITPASEAQRDPFVSRCEAVLRGEGLL